MKDIKNANGKLVCRVNESDRIVEILHKGCRTLVHFMPDGTVKVINSPGPLSP